VQEFVAKAINHRVKTIDKDGDGKLTKEEINQRVGEHFDKVDANKDGFIDETEISGHLTEMMKHFRGGRAHKGGEQDKPAEEKSADDQPAEGTSEATPPAPSEPADAAAAEPAAEEAPAAEQPAEQPNA
jgi:hypothetical protein